MPTRPCKQARIPAVAKAVDAGAQLSHQRAEEEHFEEFATLSSSSAPSRSSSPSPAASQAPTSSPRPAMAWAKATSPPPGDQLVAQAKPVWAATLADSYATWEDFFRAIDRLGRETFQLFRNRTSNTAEWRNRHIDLRGSKRTRRKHAPNCASDEPPTYIPPQLFSHYSRTLVCTHGLQNLKKPTHHPPQKKLRHHKYRRFVGCQCKIHATVRRKLDGSFFIGVRTEGDAHNHQLTKELYEMMTARHSPKLGEFARTNNSSSSTHASKCQRQGLQHQEQEEDHHSSTELAAQDHLPQRTQAVSNAGGIASGSAPDLAVTEATTDRAHHSSSDGPKGEEAPRNGRAKRHRNSQYKQLMQQLHLQQQEGLAQQLQIQQQQTARNQSGTVLDSEQLGLSASELPPFLSGSSNGEAPPLSHQLQAAIKEILFAAEEQDDWGFAKDAFVQFDSSHHDTIVPEEWQVYDRGLDVLVHEHAVEELAKVFENLSQHFQHTGQLQSDLRFNTVYLRYCVYYHCNCVGNPVNAMEFVSKLQEEHNAAPRNDCYIAIMNALARQDRVANKSQVLQLYGLLDPSKGPWTSFMVSRVIETLAIIGEPTKAFEFYETVKLTTMTAEVLASLLHCCYKNNCPQEALRFLANGECASRSRDSNLFNGMLKTLEWLDRPQEMLSVLNEMEAKHVPFTSKTTRIVARNQLHLQGTAFDIGPSMGRGQNALSRFQLDHCARKLQLLVATDHAGDAVEMALRIIRLLQDQQQDPEAVSPAKSLRVPFELSERLVDIAMKMQRYDLLRELLDSFAGHKGDYERSIRKVLNHFHALAVQQPENSTFVELAFAAIQAMEFQLGDQVLKQEQTYMDVLALQSSANDPRSWTRFALLFKPSVDSLATVGEKQLLLDRYIQLLLKQKKLTISELVSQFAVLVDQQPSSLSCGDVCALILKHLCEPCASQKRKTGNNTRHIDDEEAGFVIETVHQMELRDVPLNRPLFSIVIHKLCFAKALRYRLWVLHKYEQLEPQSKPQSSSLPEAPAEDTASGPSSAPPSNTVPLAISAAAASADYFKYPLSRYRDLLQCCTGTDRVDLAERILAKARQEYATLVPVAWHSILVRMCMHNQRFDKALRYLRPLVQRQNGDQAAELDMRELRDVMMQLLRYFAQHRQWLLFDSLFETTQQQWLKPWRLELLQPLVETVLQSNEHERIVQLLSFLTSALTDEDKRTIWQQERRQSTIRQWFDVGIAQCRSHEASDQAAMLEDQQRVLFAACEAATAATHAPNEVV